MVSTVHLVMTVLYLGTILLMAAETVLTATRMRRMPPEVVQLQLFRAQPRLTFALVAFGAGITLGIITVLPLMLEVSVPDLWYYGMSVASAALAWYAILDISRMFRVRRAPPRAHSEETLQ